MTCMKFQINKKLKPNIWTFWFLLVFKNLKT